MFVNCRILPGHTLFINARGTVVFEGLFSSELLQVLAIRPISVRLSFTKALYYVAVLQTIKKYRLFKMNSRCF
jgi:hypothetical protein